MHKKLILLLSVFVLVLVVGCGGAEATPTPTPGIPPGFPTSVLIPDAYLEEELPASPEERWFQVGQTAFFEVEGSTYSITFEVDGPDESEGCKLDQMSQNFWHLLCGNREVASIIAGAATYSVKSSYFK